MKLQALLRKDLCVLMKQMRMFLVFILFFAVMPGINLNIFAIIYSAMLPYTALSYDAQSHWDNLAAMMPYTDRDLVLSKYLLGWLFIGGASILSVCARIVTAPLFHVETNAAGIAMGFSLGALLMALTLPLIFRFGVERGRMVFLLAVCGGAGIIGAFNTVNSLESLPSLAAAEILLPLLAAALSLVSVPVSIRLYGRRRS